MDRTDRQVAALHDISHNTAKRYRQRLLDTGLDWGRVSECDELALDAVLNDARERNRRRFVEPDCTQVHQELKRKGVTEGLLWENTAQESAMRQCPSASSAGATDATVDHWDW